MKKYANDDMVTFYFVVCKDERGNKKIQGWTDQKEYALYYIDFHKCKNFKLTKHTMIFDDMINIINENNNDEISLYNIETKNRDSKRKKGNETSLIVIPMTETERIFVFEECKTLVATRINYSYINSAIDYLKSKYRKALKGIFLDAAIRKVVHNQQSSIDNFKIDELLVLYHSFPENFGI